MCCRLKISKTLKEWIEPIAKRVRAEVLLADDTDSFKELADDRGLLLQVCKSHALCDTQTLIDQIHLQAERDAYGSLNALGVTPEQAIADLQRLDELEASIGATWKEFRLARTNQLP